MNFTATDSEVIYNDTDTYINTQGSEVKAASLFANGRDTRLQGQSEEIANLQLGSVSYTHLTLPTILLV